MPQTTYFSVGNATAALAFTFAIQQFLKPIYLFRLRAFGLRVQHLIGCVFLGFVFALVAMVLPEFNLAHTNPFEYPVVWEFAGVVFVGVAYGVAGFITLVPAKLYRFNLFKFVGAGADLLSSADDADRAAFAEDLLSRPSNITRLFHYASAIKTAELRSASLEMEALQEKGLPRVIHGRPRINPFYAFAHRLELERASWAGSFLAILADPQFCSVLVSKRPWTTARMLRMIGANHLHVEQAEEFIQEIAFQALVDENSMMAREVNYGGFGRVPLLSESLFGNWSILRNFRPLQKLHFHSVNPSDGYVRRLNSAAEEIVQTAIDKGDYWEPSYVHGVTAAYEHLAHHTMGLRAQELQTEFMVPISMGIKQLCDIVETGLGKLEAGRRRGLFVTDTNNYQGTLVHEVAKIVFDSLEAIANSFAGASDRAWHHAITIFMELYPSFGAAHAGMNPLQQQLAVMLIDKLRQNMDGFYPAISRVLIAVIGPYADRERPQARTAFIILKDAVYKELQKLSVLNEKNPGKATDYVPSDDQYDPQRNVLSHVYRGGHTQETDLTALNIPDVDLLDEVNWTL